MIILGSPYVILLTPSFRYQLYLWTWLAGFAILFERPNRQAELAAYCLSHGLNSVYNHFRISGTIEGNSMISGALMMIASAIIMTKNAGTPGKTMHILFGEKRGRAEQRFSQHFPDQVPNPLYSRTRSLEDLSELEEEEIIRIRRESSFVSE